MNKQELAKAGVDYAKTKQSGHNYGTEYLDRTVYYTTEITDSNGRVLFGDDGKPLVRNDVLYLVGSWLSPKEFQNAEQTEKDFKELNDMFRNKMAAESLEWKIPKINQTILKIEG